MAVELSVAIIFKNEMRCLERCLQSLRPLRERLSAELVMADTGSVDGSRAVAERYADVVFDFPWVDDFAAARNAALDRCSGAWALILDCDEWLDGDVEELTAFLKGERKEQFDQVLLTIRNYTDAALSEYEDSRLYRLLNLRSKPRFVGAIHESAEFPHEPRNARFERTQLHHDGYVMLNDGSEAGEKKRARNVALLRAALDKAPDDLRTLTQYIESADREPDRFAQLRRAVALAEARADGWETYGAPLLSLAAALAYENDFPELDAWTALANERFPNSYFTRIDVAFTLAARCFERGDLAGAARWGESYLRARREFLSDEAGRQELAFGALHRDDDSDERDVRIILARAYLRLGEAKRAIPLLEGWAWEQTDARLVKNWLLALRELKTSADVDISPALRDCWERIQKPLPTPECARERVEMFRSLCEVEDAPPQTRDAERELMQLAERVKAILKSYPPDDPAVVELKNSEAYQKLRHLIEG